MTGSPIDGLPWWGKAIYYVICAPVAVYCKAAEIVGKIKKDKS